MHETHPNRRRVNLLFLKNSINEPRLIKNRENAKIVSKLTNNKINQTNNISSTKSRKINTNG